MLALLGIFLILAITETPKATPMRIDTLGVYAATLTWPNGSNDDIDLWVQDPRDNIAWYAQLTSGEMTLNGDDLGCASGTGYGLEGPASDCHNEERTIIKEAIPGEYTVNVVMFKKNDPGPTTCTVTLWRLRGDDRIMIEKHIVLMHTRQEVTAFRFTLNRAGDASNFNTLPKSLMNTQ